VGRTLTAVPGTWVPADAEASYQWRAGSKDIPGAVAPTYVVGPETVGKEISVRVTATGAAGVTTKATIGTTDVVKGRFTTIGVPTIVGTLAAGQTVTADAGTWAVVPDSFGYAWRRNGKKIKGATAATYAITPRDVGKKLSVTITGRKASYYTAAVTSAKVAVTA
jgi:hypothetical protein